MPTPGVPAWGCPWHGLVKDDLLALPTGELLPYRQPSAGFQQSGNTLLQRMPWAEEPVPVSEEQADYDIAHGRQWKPWAILAGVDRNLHGKSLGGWIYAAPDGNPWLVSGTALNDPLANPALLSGSFQFDRFGVLGGKPQRFSVPVSAATGQSTPALSLAGSLYIELMDILPDGSKAILMLHTRNIGQVITTLMPLGLFPVGFLQVELTGNPGVDLAVNVTVLKSRAETLGAGSDSGTPSVPSSNAWVIDPGSAAASTTTYSVVGGYPDCTGYREEVSVRVPITTNLGDTPPSTPSGTTRRVFVGDLSRTTAVTDRVLAMWFNAEGGAQPLTLEMTTTQTGHYPVFDFTTSGRVVYRETFTGATSGGSCVVGPRVLLENTLTYKLSRVIEYGYSSTLKLKFGGEVVELEAGLQLDIELSVIDSVYEQASTSNAESPAGELSSSTRTTFPVANWWAEQIDPGLRGLATPVSDSARYLLQNMQYGGGTNWWLGVARYSNNLFGLFAAWRTGAPVALGKYMGTISPGATTADETPLYTDAQLAARLKGSYHPVTHQVDRNQDRATCWV